MKINNCKLKIEQRGEIATLLTLLTLGLMLAGIAVGNIAVQKNTYKKTLAVTCNTTQTKCSDFFPESTQPNAALYIDNELSAQSSNPTVLAYHQQNDCMDSGVNESWARQWVCGIDPDATVPTNTTAPAPTNTTAPALIIPTPTPITNPGGSICHAFIGATCYPGACGPDTTPGDCSSATPPVVTTAPAPTAGTVKCSDSETACEDAPLSENSCRRNPPGPACTTRCPGETSKYYCPVGVSTGITTTPIPPTNSPSNNNCDTYGFQWTPNRGVCNSPASADQVKDIEAKQKKVCNNSTGGGSDAKLCYQGAKYYHFVCLFDKEGKNYQWYMDGGGGSENIIECTDKGDYAGILPTPTGVDKAIQEACNDIQADCREPFVTTFPADKHCIPGNVNEACISGRDCPDDARYGVAYPYLCDPNGEKAYMMNRYGECTSKCKGSAYNLSPTPVADCKDKPDGYRVKGSDGKRTCADMACVTVLRDVNKARWARSYLICDGNGGAYTGDVEETDWDCTPESGKEITADCELSDKNKIKPTVVESPKVKPKGGGGGGTDSSCKNFECNIKRGTYFSIDKDKKVHAGKDCTGDVKRNEGRACDPSTSSMCEFLTGHGCINSSASCPDTVNFPRKMGGGSTKTIDSGTYPLCPDSNNPNRGNPNLSCCLQQNDVPPYNPVSPPPSNPGSCTPVWVCPGGTTNASKTIFKGGDNKYYVSDCSNGSSKWDDPWTGCGNLDDGKGKCIFNSGQCVDYVVTSPNSYCNRRTEESSNCHCCYNNDIRQTPVPPTPAAPIPTTGARGGSNTCKIPPISNQFLVGCSRCLVTYGIRDKANQKYTGDDYISCGDDQKINYYCVNNSECKTIMDDPAKCFKDNMCKTSTGSQVSLPIATYSNQGYLAVINDRLAGKITTLQISAYIAGACRAPGLQSAFCDPLKGECNTDAPPSCEFRKVASNNPALADKNNSDDKRNLSLTCNDKCRQEAADFNNRVDRKMKERYGDRIGSKNPPDWKEAIKDGVVTQEDVDKYLKNWNEGNGAATIDFKIVDGKKIWTRTPDGTNWKPNPGESSNKTDMGKVTVRDDKTNTEITYEKIDNGDGSFTYRDSKTGKEITIRDSNLGTGAYDKDGNWKQFDDDKHKKDDTTWQFNPVEKNPEEHNPPEPQPRNNPIDDQKPKLI